MYISATYQVLAKKLVYADKANFVTNLEADMQRLMDCFSDFCSKFGLKIRRSKIKVIFTPVEPNILVNGIMLEEVNVFVYLSSVLAKDGALLIPKYSCSPRKHLMSLESLKSLHVYTVVSPER